MCVYIWRTHTCPVISHTILTSLFYVFVNEFTIEIEEEKKKTFSAARFVALVLFGEFESCLMFDVEFSVFFMRY